MKFRNRREISFIVIGVLLLLITVWFIIYSVNFLIKNTRSALDQEAANTKEITAFDFEGLKKLGIIQ